MADNIELNNGTGGAICAADEISAGVFAQRVKPVVGADGTGVDAVPVVAGMDTTATGVQAVGPVAQFDDTDTSTVTENQFAPLRITSERLLMTSAAVTSSALPTGASTSAKQDTIIGHVDGIEALLATIDADTGVLAAKTADFDTGAGTDTIVLVGLAKPANGGAVIAGTDTNPLIISQPTGSNLSTHIGGFSGSSVGMLGAGAVGAATQRVVLATDTTVPNVTGTVAHDSGVSGNPLQVAGAAIDNDDTAPPNRVSAEGDVTRLGLTRDGALHVLPHGPQIWSYHVNGSSALTDTSVHAAPGAGLSLYVTDIVISLGAASALNVFFEEGSTTVLGPYYLEAVNGRSMHVSFRTAKKITANTALTITTSAAVAHSVDVTGYTSQG